MQQDVQVDKSVKCTTVSILVLEIRTIFHNIIKENPYWRSLLNTLPTGQTDGGTVGVTRGRQLRVSKAGGRTLAGLCEAAVAPDI